MDKCQLLNLMNWLFKMFKMKLSQNFNLFNFFNEYKKEISFLQEEGELVGSWSNVFDHCLTEGLIADVMSDTFQVPKDALIKAAILHDWYKKFEKNLFVEHGINGAKIAEKESSKKLANLWHLIDSSKLYHSERVIELTECVGHLALDKFVNKDIKVDLSKSIMFLIDAMTLGDKICSLLTRVDILNKNPRYHLMNEEGRKIWDGKTHFQMMFEVGNNIISELSSLRKDIFLTQEKNHLFFHEIIAAEVERKFGIDILFKV